MMQKKTTNQAKKHTETGLSSKLELIEIKEQCITSFWIGITG